MSNSCYSEGGSDFGEQGAVKELMGVLLENQCMDKTLQPLEE